MHNVIKQAISMEFIGHTAVRPVLHSLPSGLYDLFSVFVTALLITVEICLTFGKEAICCIFGLGRRG